jgi:predicted 2-oxoglutarate/Fe(II)-dependent dioxygenase YbiX
VIVVPSVIFVVAGFLDEAACRRVRAAMDEGVPEPAEILDGTVVADTEVRRASHIEVDPDTLQFVEERLDEARAEVSRHFQLSLTGREGTNLLRYAPGGFFKPHRDRGEETSWPDAARRRVTVVVFLTTSQDVEPSGAHRGGTLQVWPDDDRPESLAIHARAGTLVAFPAQLRHEVTRVESGVRDAMVDWYY